MNNWAKLMVAVAMVALTACGGSDIMGNCNNRPSGSEGAITEFRVYDIVQTESPRVDGGEDEPLTVIRFRVRADDSNTQARRLKFSLFSSAVALSCNYPFNETLVWMNVVSDADFDENYPAGIPLNEIIFPEYHRQNIDEWLASEARFLSYSYLITFELRGEPTLDADHRLTFEFGLSSGNVMTVTTDTITF